MHKKTFHFSQSPVDYYFDSPFAVLPSVVDPHNTILITDENVGSLHENKLRRWKTITIKPGEGEKTASTVNEVITQLIDMGADRSTTLVGIGGGVVTDLTGYIASIYMRGIPCGFVPTTLLAMVDASIGGKNGVDVGPYKNMVGTIRQPRFILQDPAFLKTLPQEQWNNGFAEVIKHASIKDVVLFRELESHAPAHFRKNRSSLAALIRRNTLLKTKVVLADEFELGDRKFLNFGHTLGHAIENEYGLQHGEAVAIGMAFAGRLSHHFNRFRGTERLTALIEKYGLPVAYDYDPDIAYENMKKDKKGEGGMLSYVLLERIGKASIRKIPFEEVYNLL